MTDNTTDTFRSAMRTVLDMAPESPDLPTVNVPEPIHRPVAALVSGFAAVLVVVGLGTFVLTPGGNGAQDAGTGSSPPATYAQSSNPRFVPLSALPMIGTDLAGWEVGAASEDEPVDGGTLRTALYYAVVNDDTVFANLRIRGIPEGAEDEGDLLMLDRGDAEELTVRGHDARMTVDGDRFDIAWRDSSTAIVQLAINTEAVAPGRAAALLFAGSLVDLSSETWAKYLADAGDGDPAAPTAGTPTTTVTDS